MVNRTQLARRVRLVAAVALPALSAGCIPDMPVPCGGDSCPAGQFCQFEGGSCGSDELQGVCTTRAEVCTADFSPVCGCDDITYSNPCMAAAAGISVAAPGECEVAGEVCGGIAGVPCPEGEYCRFQRGVCCCDIQGVCEPTPDGCLAVFEPVCGCDGITYSNECEAARVGITVDRDGSCES